MNRCTVEAARTEAQRFIKRCDELLATQVGAYEPTTRSRVVRKWQHSTEAPKQTGAVRRASMDLTRALAEMRKP